MTIEGKPAHRGPGKKFTQSDNQPITQLLDSFRSSHFLEDERVEDGQDVLAVGDDSIAAELVPGVAARFPLPALEHLRRDVDILAESLQRMAAQEEAVEKRRFMLRFAELSIHRHCQATRHLKW